MVEGIISEAIKDAKGVRLCTTHIPLRIATHRVELLTLVIINRPWNSDIQARYEALAANTFANTQQKLDNESAVLAVAHSSSGQGHRPLKAEIIRPSVLLL